MSARWLSSRGRSRATGRLKECSSRKTWRSYTASPSGSGTGASSTIIFQMGGVGLKAVKRRCQLQRMLFDSRGSMIMGEIRWTLRDDGMVKSAARSAKPQNHHAAQETLQCMPGRSPTLQEVADHCGLKPEEISLSRIAGTAVDRRAASRRRRRGAAPATMPGL